MTRTLRQPPAQTEKAFQAQIVELAGLLGYLTYHTYDSRRSTSGFPDLVMVRPEGRPGRPRRVLFAELKVGRGRVTPAQHQWLATLAAAGAEAYCWFPEDWHVIEHVLSRGPLPGDLYGERGAASGSETSASTPPTRC